MYIYIHTYIHTYPHQHMCFHSLKKLSTDTIAVADCMDVSLKLPLTQTLYAPQLSTWLAEISLYRTLGKKSRTKNSQLLVVLILAKASIIRISIPLDQPTRPFIALHPSIRPRPPPPLHPSLPLPLLYALRSGEGAHDVLLSSIFTSYSAHSRRDIFPPGS